MIIVHNIKPFAAGIAVFVRSLTKAVPENTWQNAQFAIQNSSQGFGNPFKVLLVLSQFSELLKKLMRMNRVEACHHHSFNDLQNSLSILKPFNSGYLNSSGKTMPKTAA